jgi:hypothetical protein
VQGFSKKSVQSFGDIKKSLAVLGVAALGAFKFFKDGYESLDRLTASAERLGISSEGFQFLEFAAKRSDVEIGNLESSIKRLKLTIAQASRGDAGQKDALKSLGLDLSKIDTQEIENTVKEIFTKLRALSATNEDIGIGTIIFGKNYQSIRQLVLSDLDEFSRKFKELGGAVDTSGFDEIDRRVNELGTKFEQAKRRAILIFGDPALKAANIFFDLIDRRTAEMTDNFERIANLSGGLDGAINAGLNTPSRIINSLAPQPGELNLGSPITPDDFGKMAFQKLSLSIEKFAVNSAGSSGVVASGANKAAQALTAFEGRTSAVSGAFDILKQKVESTNFDKMLGIGNENGQDYINSVLGNVEQVRDPRFDDLLKDLQLNRLEGRGFGRNNDETILRHLSEIANRTTVGSGQSKSGMIQAVELLKQQLKAATPQPQKVVIELKYEKDGIIKAFIGSSQFATVAGNVVMDLAAKEAQSTIASGG